MCIFGKRRLITDQNLYQSQKLCEVFVKIISNCSLKIKQFLHIASHNYLLHITPARGPPGWQDIEELFQFDNTEPQCKPEYDVHGCTNTAMAWMPRSGGFDQTVNW